MNPDETIQPNYLEIGSDPVTSNEGFDPEATPEANSPTTPPTPPPTNPNIVQLGEDGVLTFGNLRSPNFSTGNSGWRITSNGDVEFGSGYFRGDITGATGTFTGNISGGSIDIGGSDSTSFHVDTSGNMWLGASAFNIATNPFAVSSAGVLRATSGTIGGFTMSATELYGGIIKTGATVGVGSNGVIMDTAGLRMYDSVLGLVVNLPSNGDAPEFSSGVISQTTFEINTNAVMRTSATVGDGTANSAGILINNTGFYATEANQLLADANVRILTDGSGFFRGTFSIGGTTITIDNTQSIQDNLDAIETAGGGTLWLQPGTYTLTADVLIPSGVILQGVSRDGVIIDCDGTYAVKITGSNAYSTGTVTINNGDTTVVGSGTTWTSAMVGRYILLDGLWYEITARTDNTHITITTYVGVNLSGSVYVLADVNFSAKIKDVTITGATGSGLVIQYAMEPIANNLVIYSCGTGIEMDYVTYPKLEVTSNENGVNLNMNYVEGFFVDYSDLSYSTSGNGVTMTNTRNSTFFNSSVNDNTGDGINLTTCSKIAFISFDISGNGGQGVEMVSACDDNQFTDGVIDGNTSDGIKLTATSDRNTLVAVSIKNNGGYGINIAASTCDNNQIIAPAFDGNTSGEVSDSGTDTILLPNHPNFIADEDLTKGQAVGISNYVSGKVARAFRRSSDVTLSFTSEQDLTSPNYSCAIGGDKFVFVQSQASDDSLYATVGSINTSTKTVTLGTSLAVTADILQSVFCVCKLDTDKFIVFYKEDASTTIIKYRVGTVSGTTITYGSAATFATAATTFTELAASYISANKGIMLYKCTTQTNGRAIAFTVSGTTATAGTPIAMGTSTDEDTPTLVKVIATDKFAIMATTGGASGYIQIGTLSGTTITFGTEVQFSTTVGNNINTLDLISPTTDVIVLCWQNSGTSQLDMIAATVSGTTPTFGSILAGVVSSSGNFSLYAESSTSILVMASSISQGGVEKVTRSGTSLTDNGLIIQGISTNPNKFIAIDNGYWVIIGASSVNFYMMIQGMANQYFGFAESTASKGSSLGIVTSGKVGGLSGLIPGGLYQVTSTGLVFSAYNATMNTADDVYVRASSDTEVVL